MFYQDGKSYSAGFVATVQFFTLLSIISLLNLVFRIELNKIILILIGLILHGVNAYRYESNFDIKELHDKWSSESLLKKKINGWGIFLYTILVVALPLKSH